MLVAESRRLLAAIACGGSLWLHPVSARSDGADSHLALSELFVAGGGLIFLDSVGLGIVAVTGVLTLIAFFLRRGGLHQLPLQRLLGVCVLVVGATMLLVGSYLAIRLLKPPLAGKSLLEAFALPIEAVLQLVWGALLLRWSR